MSFKQLRNIAVLICLIAGSVLIAEYTFAQARQEIKQKRGKFVTAVEKGAMHAFRMKEGYKGDAAAKQLAEKLFKKAKADQIVSLKDDKANNLIHVGQKDPSAYFRINKKTGDFSFNKGIKDYASSARIDSLPAKDKAPDIAKKHLQDLGLMPDNAGEMVVRHVGGLKMVELKDDGSVNEVDKLVTVQFGRKIDGVDVSGPGSKIIVSLGANGELVALQKRWSEVRVEKKKNTDYKSQADVHANMRSKMAREASNAKKIDINAPDFAYFDDGNGNIEPAYIFTAELSYDSDEARAGKGHVEKYFGAVAALKGPKADFEQLRKAGKQPGKAQKPAKEKPPKDDT